MPKIKEKNVFVSHYKKDEEYINRLKSDLGKSGGYKLSNYSIDSSKENKACPGEKFQIADLPLVSSLVSHGPFG